MNVKKMSLSSIKGSLSKSEMKKIMAGCDYCNGNCPGGNCIWCSASKKYCCKSCANCSIS